MTNTANLKRFSDRTEQILSTIKSGNRMSLGTSGDLKTQLEAITDKYSSVLVEAPQDPVKGDKWFDGKSTWTYDTDAQAWLPDFVTPNKSYFSFAATVPANAATDLTQAIEIQDNDFYKVTIDFVSATGAWQVFFTVKEDNGAKIWNGTSWVGQDAEVDCHSFSGDTDSVAHLVFRPISKSSESDHSKFKLVITSTTSSDYRGTAVIDHLATGALTDGAVYDTTTGGGGGSGDGFQPDRVIVINTTLAQDVPGKAYRSYSDAYDYTVSQQPVGGELRFCIQLPAGNFNQAVTLNDWLTVKGNNTVLTGTLTSLAVFDMMSGQHEPVEYICGDKRHLVGCTVKSSIVNGPGFTYTIMENCDFAPVSFTDDSSSPQTMTYMHAIIMIGCRTYPGTYNMGRTIIYAQSSVLSGSFTTTALHGTGDPSTDAALAGAATWMLSNCLMWNFSLSNTYATNMLYAVNSLFFLRGGNVTHTVISGDFPEFVGCQVDGIQYTGKGAVFNKCTVTGDEALGQTNTFTITTGVNSQSPHLSFVDCWGRSFRGVFNTTSAKLDVSITGSRLTLVQPTHAYSAQSVEYTVERSTIFIEQDNSVDPGVPSAFGENEIFTFRHNTVAGLGNTTFTSGNVVAYPTCLVGSNSLSQITAGTYDPNHWHEY